MKFLFVCTKGGIFDIPWTLKEFGYDVTVYEECFFDPNNHNPADSENQIFYKWMQNLSFDYVISYLFIPVIADICYEKKIPYISWTYDSPLAALFSKSIFHPTNYCFIFDYAECLRLKEIGAPHIYHMPLAANLNRIGILNLTLEDEKEFSHDICFVGNLYQKNEYNSLIHAFPEQYQLELKLYLLKNLCKWDTFRPWPELSDSIISYMASVSDVNNWKTPELMTHNTFVGISVLSRKLGEMERITVLNTLASQFKVDLYTNSDTPFLQNVNIHSNADYYTDANKIFHLSKINLNITLPSIETGLPQRIFDIMGCGGFVLTNYQAEIEDLFEIGKEIEVFHNLDELIEKCSYYLTHEEERIRIAMNGYKKVRDNYTYHKQLENILSIVVEENKENHPS